ncbi:MAG TPA: glyoxalase [Phycisphaerales bacterium]|nr:glyoxalase [Phycisphaerales bacterium]
MTNPRVILACVLLWLAPACGALAQAVRAVESVAITVSDLDASIRWYTRVLHATAEPKREHAGDGVERLFGVFPARVRTARVRIGDEAIDLVQFLAPSGRPMPADSRANDRWFQHAAIVVRDMDEAYDALRDAGVAFASSEPQRLPDWNPGAGGIRAFYFRDPDGHFLEVIWFPPGKGDPRWQQRADRLFLGIDHTAIVVDDTDAALRFYRDTLGLRVVGAGENYGPEQERLNAVFPARLRITTLRAPGGPGVELLEYLTPRDGRPAPLDSRASDLWHWHVVMTTPDDPAPLFSSARRAGGAPVSPFPVDADFPAPENAESLLVRDPDGHAVLVTRAP